MEKPITREQYIIEQLAQKVARLEYEKSSLLFDIEALKQANEKLKSEESEGE